MSLTNKALFVIERNLDRDLTLGELAKSCGVSRFHLAHAFGEAAGRPVMEYVRERRLSEAAVTLAAGAGDILAVALDSGYASHEAFTRAFRARFGTTPEEVRRRESVEGLALANRLRLADARPAILKPPRFEDVGELLFVGLRERCPYGAVENIPGQWQRFMANFYRDIEHKAAVPPVGIGLAGEGDGEIDYVCAAEVTRFGAVPQGLAKVVVAPARYAVFAHDGHVTALQQTYVAIWNEWFELSGHAPAEAPGLERHNPAFDPRTGNGGATIWVPLAA